MERIVSGMRQALVEHAQDDVDGPDGGEDQQALRTRALLEHESVAGELRVQTIGQVHLCHRLPYRVAARLEGRARCEIVGQGDGRERALVVDHEG